MLEKEPPLERPRREPEILPPDRGRESDRRHLPLGGNIFDEMHRTHRVYVAGMGPFGLGILMLAFIAVAAIVMIAVLGAVLVWIPLAAAVLVIAAVFRRLRG